VRRRNKYLTAIFLPLLAGCGSAQHVPPIQESASVFPASAKPVRYQKLWSKKVPGLLTDLSLARDGSTLLVATVPDKDSLEASANRSQYFAVFYNSAGKLLSQTPMPAQIKSHTLSTDGSVAVIATYDDMIRAYNRSGKQLWEAEAFCKPILLSTIQKVLCFHDDDAEPELGFEVFDWNGKKLSEFPIQNDALVLKVSADEKYFVMALTHGKLIVFDSQFKPVARKTVSGEIVDVAISSADSYEVLYNEKKSAKQRLERFGANKKTIEIPVSERADQIETSADGQFVFGYSNGSEGQRLVRFGKSAAESWTRSAKASAEYSSQAFVGNDAVWISFQETTDARSSRSRVLAFDWAGGLKTELQVPAAEGALLYSFALDSSAQHVAIGSDDGRLSYFAVEGL
jgi:hypothetical protein